MLCYVMLCYVMLCYVMLCYVMLCYVTLCYVMLCYVKSFSDGYLRLQYCSSKYHLIIVCEDSERLMVNWISFIFNNIVTSIKQIKQRLKTCIAQLMK